MTAKSDAIIKRCGLTLSFKLELGRKKWQKEGYSYPFNGRNKICQKIAAEAVEEWYDKRKENRIRLVGTLYKV